MSKDGGRAFPSTEVWHPTTGEPLWKGEGGMYLRDYFAANAMQAIIGNQKALDELHKVVAKDEQNGAIARVAYGFADAMLKARG